jgi:acetylornithine deacetylase/succinyl-diaminopimelate desuccinylase-like protein
MENEAMSPTPAASAAMNELNRYFDSHADRFLDDLKAALRIPSVSTEERYGADVRRCADHFAAHLRELGMHGVEVIPTEGHPIVYAEWLGVPGKPTALIYGHYDVQPVEPLELWKTPPFEPEVRNGNLYARGAVDDKGQVYMHLKAIEGWMKVHGALPINVKLVIEGEEENGSEALYPFIEANRKKLACDVIVVSDTAMLGPDQPALTYGLRGLLYTQIEVTGPANDLHSGHFGGAVANPGVALAQIIAGLKDADGRVTVPGFYDDVRELSAEERALLADVPFDERGYLAEAGASMPFGEKGFTTLERISVRPTLDVNGMWGGYQGEGSKTVLPSFFAAKVSMRLVPDQDPGKIADQFEAYLKKVAPKTVELSVIRFQTGQPWMTDFDNRHVQAAARAIERGFGKAPVFNREGGSIPVVSTFQQELNVPSVLFGIGLPDENAHAPNEKLDLTNFHNGVIASAYLYEEIGRLNGPS